MFVSLLCFLVFSFFSFACLFLPVFLLCCVMLGYVLLRFVICFVSPFVFVFRFDLFSLSLSKLVFYPVINVNKRIEFYNL